MAAHVEQGDTGGVAWLAARDNDIAVGVSGSLTRGEPEPVRRDSMFRIASMTKPVTAVAALMLVEECRLRLDDSVDDLLPELANRRVLVDGRGPMDCETVPAARPITVSDVLTFRLGWGLDFEAPWPQPQFEAMGDLGLGGGPPQPQAPPDPDEWIRRMGTLPLLYQPGEADSGRSRPPFPRAVAASCRPSTTTSASAACCSPADGCPTDHGCCRGRRSRP